MSIAAALKASKLTVQDLLEEMGLTENDISILQAEIKLSGEPKLRLKSRFGSIPSHQMDAIGAAIARKQNRLYLDAEERKPLSIPANALIFGFQQCEKFIIEKYDLDVLPSIPE